MFAIQLSAVRRDVYFILEIMMRRRVRVEMVSLVLISLGLSGSSRGWNAINLLRQHFDWRFLVLLMFLRRRLELVRHAVIEWCILSGGVD